MKWLKQRFIGGRIVKTGVAVFLTALICQLFNLPVVFAVITAIVTIEPTAADSIRKGLIRFPASAIGASIAMLATFLLCDHAITYTISAVLTIWICYKLKLEAGMLVATLTAVAMIPGADDHFLLEFIKRLGTTGIGILTSTLVNFVLMPPKYKSQIIEFLYLAQSDVTKILTERMNELLDQKPSALNLESASNQLRSQLDRAETFCRYQLQEWHYHSYKREEMNEVQMYQKKIYLLRQLSYHLSNLVTLPTDEIPEWSIEEKKAVRTLISQLNNRIIRSDEQEPVDPAALAMLRSALKGETDEDELPAKSYIYFELLSIHALLRKRKSFVAVPSVKPGEL
ncbi:aromatic acid exporter family protein [Jeotgalibacillus aurantiacus]|uniref:aromatic acid exporter family protein n=1 Tax=Jeotgalibacillus aurantiacus TaxID=2763266 RepID=UPI001D0A3E4A|nr:aromatic acid exporter family protein [Jeotgalibacillus aurantiacus]